MDSTTRELANHLTATFDDNKAELFLRRWALSKAITLAESRAPTQQQQAALLLTHLLQQQAAIPSFRIGIAGAPGAGKSTFIAALGQYVLSQRDQDDASPDDASSSLWYPSQLAVLCIDPSSAVSGGSILGDKTRMTELSRNPRAYVRPAPAAGVLGGLAAATYDVMTLCASAGYDCVLLETVGLGQSELDVAQSVDMLILLVPPAGGDDLQGVKKGIVEVADLIVVSKADGSLEATARQTANDYRMAMKLLLRQEQSDETPVVLASAVTGKGLSPVWEHVSKARQELLLENGVVKQKRQQQDLYWMWKNLDTLVREETRSDPILSGKARELQVQLMQGQVTPRVAATQLFETLTNQKKK